ncbi:hypothetical protein [Cochleicola gelatinilyticus]|uniref:Uncharacterized protein n=1 Tax=Cochleicola gelatinilyticus TaxID=1763537 RepID=A0A167ERB0_9FLAO|nr:hypothetical protein [Cochleicola gelatinilyticus]OAB75799.1 hypothetical protein ULVI_15090 [Cochleicola gelatinilyticus]
MRLPKPILPFIFIFFSISISKGQTIRLDKTALAGLVSEETVNVIFAYNELTFDVTYIPEEEYLKEIHEKIARRSNPKAAYDWQRDFKKGKEEDFPKAFVAILNEELKDHDKVPTFILGATNSNYTLVVHTHWMNFGWDIGAVKQPTKARMTLYFYRTNDPVNFISKTEIRNAEGLVSDSRYGNGLGPLPSLASLQHVYERVAPNLAKGLKRIVK